METQLPGVLSDYFSALRANDCARAAASFADHAVVVDERRRHVGRQAIEVWIEETQSKYSPVVEVLASHVQGEQVEVTARVRGTFPGSPIQLSYVFIIQSSAIVSLEIH